jgi:hypothetical protein
MPPLKDMFFAVGLTFFAYQGFSVITNTVEDMADPSRSVLKAMFIAIGLVALLYAATEITKQHKIKLFYQDEEAVLPLPHGDHFTRDEVVELRHILERFGLTPDRIEA